MWKYPLYIKFHAVSDAINYYKDWFWDIIGQTYFPQKISRNWGQCQPWEGYHTLIPLITLISQWLIVRAKIGSCSIVKHQLGLPWQNINTLLGYEGSYGLELRFTGVPSESNVHVISSHLKVKLEKILKIYTLTYLQLRWPLEFLFAEYVWDW